MKQIPVENLSIAFEKASIKHQALIFKWLDEPHMKEFWDNTQAHKDDILNFIHGRQQTYFYGTTQYWIGYVQEQPFSFLLSDQICDWQEMAELNRKHLSTNGHTVCLDFGIGNVEWLGRGLAAPTLIAFMAFYRQRVDEQTDTFFIDPDISNPRAKHVYEKAGFEYMGDYTMHAMGAFAGKATHLLVKKF